MGAPAKVTSSAAVPVETLLARDIAVETRPARRAAPDVAAITGRWDDLVDRMRASGKALVAAALESSSPSTITASGDLTITLDEPNDFHAKAIEQAGPELLAILGEWFAGIERVALFRESAPRSTDKPKRVTDEMVKSERLNSLRRKDAVLDAAIDVLDLEIAE